MTEETLFHEAIAQPPPERAAFLDAACAGQPELRAAVEALLAAHEASGDLLDRPAAELGHTVDRDPGAAHPCATTEHTPEPDEGPPRLGTTTDFEPEIVPGMVIAARYTLVEKIGDGGMGEVWVAKQTEPVKRKVALKLIKAGMDSKAVLQRFEQERQALALMDHPHIAKVLDGGLTRERRPFFVMELVNGLPLTRFCDEAKLGIRERLEVFTPICQAVQHAHQKGIIHRDLKPSNILVTIVDGKAIPKVIDFGVAKATSGRLTDASLSTQFGAVIGTLEYMAPEQAGFAGEDVDTRADIYSLGVILYELLTGLRPLDAARLRKAALTEMIRIIKEEEPSKPSIRLSTDASGPSLAALRHTEPRKLAALLRGELDWVVMKCLEKQRDRRYETASGLARDIQRYLADEPVEARPPSAGYRLRKYARKHRRLLATTAAFGVLLVLGAVLSTWQAVRATRAEAQAKANEAKAYEQEQKARRAAEAEAVQRQRAEENERQAKASEAQVRLTLTDMHTSHGLMAGEREDPAQALLWFATAARLAGAGTERESANRVRVASWSREALIPVRALPHSAGVPRFQFHPSGQYALTQTNKGDCALWDLARETPFPLPAGIGLASSAVWSADGKWLALGTPQGEVIRWSFPAGEVQQRVPFSGRVHALTFSPDDRLLAIASANRVRVWDCRAGAFATPELKHPEDIVALVFHPEGHRLATSCQDDQARVFAISDTAAEPLFVVDHFRVSKVSQPHFVGLPVAPTFLDGGRGLLTNTRDSELAWRDAETGAVIRSVPLKTDILRFTGIATTIVSPDGKYFVVAGGGGAQIWEVATGRAVSPLFCTRGTPITNSAAFSPDGRTLLTGCSDGTLQRWAVPSGQAVGRPLAHPTAVSMAACSPDGRFLATAQDGGLVRLWASPAHNPGSHAVPLDGMGSLAQLSPDARYVLATGHTIETTLLRTHVAEVATGQPAGPALEARGIITNASFSPDGRQVAVLESQARTTAERYRQNGQQPGHVELWDWRTGKPICAPVPMPSEPRDLDYSPDGQRLAVLCSGGQLLLIHPLEGRILSQWQATRPIKFAFYVTAGGIRFSPDGRSLLTYRTDSRVRVWDATTGKVRYPGLPHRDTCLDAQFSADGRLLVTAAYDKTVRVWDYATGRSEAEPLVHPAVVLAVAFSRDGQHVLTACADKMARLWDWRTHQLVCPPFVHEHAVSAAAFHPNRRWILTGSRDKIMRIWEWQTGKPVTPPLATGGTVLNLGVTPDGQYAVVGGFMDALKVFDLGYLSAPNELDGDDLCAWGELVSGQRIQEGGGVTNLTAEEWLQRRRAFRQRHPEYPKMEPTAATMMAGAEPLLPGSGLSGR